MRQALKIRLPYFSLKKALEDEAETRKHGRLEEEDIFDDDIELEDSMDEECRAASPLPPIFPDCRLSPTPASTSCATDITASDDLLPAASNPSASSSIGIDRSTPSSQGRRCKKKMATKRAKERARRVQIAQARQEEYKLKPTAVKHAQQAQAVVLPNLNCTQLPISSTAFTGKNGVCALSPGLAHISRNLELLSSTGGMRFVDWDGECVYSTISGHYGAHFAT